MISGERSEGEGEWDGEGGRVNTRIKLAASWYQELMGLSSQKLYKQPLLLTVGLEKEREMIYSQHPPPIALSSARGALIIRALWSCAPGKVPESSHPGKNSEAPKKKIDALGFAHVEQARLHME